ncbi:hypothetical protein NDU88_006382 [Pleurodeles waltl]|uniref:Uncharacterized protein n=1 Tax=Pleurodeles waltl TaxID=8319 RepID=A0AAV7MZ07_PLEWA|nr:hypothetical protein NDU88_006382 [Pleurodeles waltl]
MRDPNLEEAIQIAKRMEHAAVWLQEMDVKSTQAEQGIVAEIKRKEEPRGAVRWNKFDKDDDDLPEPHDLDDDRSRKRIPECVSALDFDKDHQAFDFNRERFLECHSLAAASFASQSWMDYLFLSAQH